MSLYSTTLSPHGAVAAAAATAAVDESDGGEQKALTEMWVPGAVAAPWGSTGWWKME